MLDRHRNIGPRHERSEGPTQLDIASLYRRNPTYDKAALLIEHYPDIEVKADIRAILPLYLERRNAAAAVLAKDPNATRDLLDYGTAHEVTGTEPIQRPPSKDELKALRELLDQKVKRYRELTRPLANGIDYAGDFAAAAWTPGGPIAAYAAWTASIAAEYNRVGELADLKIELGMRGPHVGWTRHRPLLPGEPCAWVALIPTMLLAFCLIVRRSDPLDGVESRGFRRWLYGRASLVAAVGAGVFTLFGLWFWGALV